MPKGTGSCSSSPPTVNTARSPTISPTGETLADRRRAETERSAAALGVDEVVWLGYADSGMTGWDANEQRSSRSCKADVDEAATRLAAILREQRADVLTIYDWHGNYGHPDHIKVYQVGCRAERDGRRRSARPAGVRGDDEPRRDQTPDGDRPGGR